MKLKLLILSFLFTFVCWAGNEVPWPIDQQEPLLLKSIHGYWLSSNPNMPAQMYSIQIVRNNSISCPTQVLVKELNVANPEEPLLQGKYPICQVASSLNNIRIVLFDAYGRPQKYIDIIGIKGAKNNQQSLGLSIYGVEGNKVIEDRVQQDIFVKIKPLSSGSKEKNRDF